MHHVRCRCGSPEWYAGVTQNTVGANAPCCRNAACSLAGPSYEQVPTCASLVSGQTYWLTDDHTFTCSGGACNDAFKTAGTQVLVRAAHGALPHRAPPARRTADVSAYAPCVAQVLVVHGKAFERFDPSTCAKTAEAAGVDVLGHAPLVAA